MTNIVLFSGGNDSTKILESVPNSIAVIINYGQKAWREEYRSARAIAKELNVPLEALDLSSLYSESENPLITGRHVETIEETVVPFRNALFVSAVVAWALDKYMDTVTVFIGVHKSTIEDMNDCSQKFIDLLNATVQVGTGGKATVKAPFVSSLKKDILASEKLRKMTYTCYEGVAGGCGKCIACKTMQNLVSK